MSDLTVMLPLDGSPPAEQALVFLFALRRLPNLRVRLLSVVESDAGVSGEQETAREWSAAEYQVATARRLRASLGAPVECVRRTGKPYFEILEEANDQDVNLILMTTHGRTSGQGDQLGSVADKVIRSASCPTLLVGPHASLPSRIEMITVPLDGSSLAAEAIPVAGALADGLGSRVRLVQAVQYPPSAEGDSSASLAAGVIEATERAALSYLDAARLELKTSQPVETAVLSGRASEALLADLEENPPDLLVMTSHGRTGFVKWALGSVTDRLIRGPVPVLVLRPEQEVGDRLLPFTSLRARPTSRITER